MIEAERITIERLADIADAIRPQDVERKGAQASDHARLATDAAVVLTETLVTDMPGSSRRFMPWQLKLGLRGS